MNKLYDEAIAGRLVSLAADTSASVQVYNQLPVEVFVYSLSSAGTRKYIGSIEPGANAPISGAVNSSFVFASALSGSFISAYTISSATSYTLDSSVLSEPNHVGLIPEATKELPVPVNSPLVMVACAKVTVESQENFITREQYWNLQGDSYSLTVGESRTMSFTIVSGRQETSSNENTVGASIGVNAQAGWGPMSAGISASLNASSTSFQQVSINEQRTTYISDTVTNNAEDDIVVLRWQMMDIISVYAPDYTPLSSVVSGLNPIIAKHYKLNALPEAFKRPALVVPAIAPALGPAAGN